MYKRKKYKEKYKYLLMYKYKHYILYINKARRGVFYGYIKDQDFRKNNITYESKQVESVEEKLIIINELIKQILSEVEEPLFIFKDEKDFLLCKMCIEGDLSETMTGRYVLQSPNLVEMVQNIRLNGSIRIRLAQDKDMRMVQELVH